MKRAVLFLDGVGLGSDDTSINPSPWRKCQIW
jgi:hypothetical protein